tara:strand:- start:234 stop:839 length:606 start_codon:yes stop_codon:yes gene_type:complete
MALKTLRKKFINPNLINKTCSKCNKTYPRDEQHYYRKIATKINTWNYESACITCTLEKTNKWKRNNRDRIERTQLEYIQTEKGWFKELFNHAKGSKYGCEFKNYEEFFDCWIEQKKTFGTKCPYFNIEMTRIRGANVGNGRRITTETNLSKDRIISSKPYSKKNIMFVCWKANNMKNNISPKIAKRYLELVKERFGTDEME